MVDVAEQQINLSDPSLYINRELSWLGFNERVLAQARDERRPLLERLRFVSISETNLDEFFMIRIAGLQQQVLAELPNLVPDGMTPEEQLRRIHEHTGRFFADQRTVLEDELLPALKEEGIELTSHDDLSKGEQRELRKRFTQEVLPILTPLAVDPAHPFPHISNLSLNLLVVVEEVIAANLDELFPGKEILASYVFQVTPNAHLVIEEDEASDLLQAIEDELEGRWFGQSVRLMVTDWMPEDLREWLAEHLRVEENAVCAAPEPLGLGDFEELTHLDRGTSSTRLLRRTSRRSSRARAPCSRRSGRGTFCSTTPTTRSHR